MNIRQIVRLRQLLKKWQAKALTRKRVSATMNGCVRSPLSVDLQQAVSSVSYDTDEEIRCWHAPSPPADVPEGYLAVYVSTDRRRYVIPTSYLNRPAFRALLDLAAEEFGFQHSGGLTISCDVVTFERILLDEGSRDPARDRFDFRGHHAAAMSAAY